MINSDRKLGIEPCVDEVSSAMLCLTHGLYLVRRNHSNGEKLINIIRYVSSVFERWKFKDGAQGHRWLHSELEFTMASMTAYLKTNTQQRNKVTRSGKIVEKGQLNNSGTSDTTHCQQLPVQTLLITQPPHRPGQPPAQPQKSWSEAPESCRAQPD